jgi:hypothetical protein
MHSNNIQLKKNLGDSSYLKKKNYQKNHLVAIKKNRFPWKCVDIQKQRVG